MTMGLRKRGTMEKWDCESEGLRKRGTAQPRDCPRGRDCAPAREEGSVREFATCLVVAEASERGREGGACDAPAMRQRKQGKLIIKN